LFTGVIAIFIVSKYYAAKTAVNSIKKTKNFPFLTKDETPFLTMKREEKKSI